MKIEKLDQLVHLRDRVRKLESRLKYLDEGNIPKIWMDSFDIDIPRESMIKVTFQIRVAIDEELKETRKTIQYLLDEK